MYVSSRSELTVKFKKGCKDAEYFFNLQASAAFCGLSMLAQLN